jgi:hypothetical protein
MEKRINRMGRYMGKDISNTVGCDLMRDLLFDFL